MRLCLSKYTTSSSDKFIQWSPCFSPKPRAKSLCSQSLLVWVQLYSWIRRTRSEEVGKLSFEAHSHAHPQKTYHALSAVLLHPVIWHCILNSHEKDLSSILLRSFSLFCVQQIGAGGIPVGPCQEWKMVVAVFTSATATEGLTELLNLPWGWKQWSCHLTIF